MAADPQSGREQPRTPVRRGFVDVVDGQIHYRAAGLDARSARLPLVCLHQSPSSCLTYLEILPFLGAARRTVAFDTPGFGESFRPAAKPSIADYAGWLEQAAAAIGFARFDVMGLFTGAAIAAHMAITHPDRVRRVILLGPPLFSPEEQQKYLTGAWPPRPKPDGSHLLPEWNRIMTRALPDVPFPRRCDAFHEFWRGGGDAIWGEEAVSVYPLKDTLPRVRQSTLVVQPDGILGRAAEAAALLPNARLEHLDGVRGWSMMQTAPDRIAALASDFLNEDPA